MDYVIGIVNKFLQNLVNILVGKLPHLDNINKYHLI